MLEMPVVSKSPHFQTYTLAFPNIFEYLYPESFYFLLKQCNIHMVHNQENKISDNLQ